MSCVRLECRSEVVRAQEGSGGPGSEEGDEIGRF